MKCGLLGNKKLPTASLKLLTKNNQLAPFKETLSTFSSNTRSVRKLECIPSNEGKKKNRYTRLSSPGIKGKIVEDSYKRIVKTYSASKISIKRNKRQQILYKSYNKDI